MRKGAIIFMKLILYELPSLSTATVKQTNKEKMGFKHLRTLTKM